MAKATIKIKKSDFKKLEVATRMNGIKILNPVPVNETVIAELDYRSPVDLWEAAQLFTAVKGDEFDAADKLAADKAKANAAKK